jgi:hypothetical protein
MIYIFRQEAILKNDGAEIKGALVPEPRNMQQVCNTKSPSSALGFPFARGYEHQNFYPAAPHIQFI